MLEMYKTRERERNVLFNDALNTFYLRLYGVIHMVKDHSDSERGNPLPPHRLLFPISSKGSFICSNGSTPCRIDPTTHRTMSERSTSELRPAPVQNKCHYPGWKIANQIKPLKISVTTCISAIYKQCNWLYNVLLHVS